MNVVKFNKLTPAATEAATELDPAAHKYLARESTLASGRQASRLRVLPARAKYWFLSVIVSGMCK